MFLSRGNIFLRASVAANPESVSVFHAPKFSVRRDEQQSVPDAGCHQPFPSPLPPPRFPLPPPPSPDTPQQTARSGLEAGATPTPHEHTCWARRGKGLVEGGLVGGTSHGFCCWRDAGRTRLTAHDIRDPGSFHEAKLLPKNTAFPTQRVNFEHPYFL